MTDDTKREPVRWDWNTILNAKEAEKLGRDRITISVPVKDILYGTPLPSADTKREPAEHLVARLEHQARCEITPRKSNLLSEAADTIARLEQELARPQKRDGNFLDHMGCCRVCGGEIPYGHTDYCDIWKLRQRAEAAERRVRELTDHACSENMAVVNKQIALQAAEAERHIRRVLSPIPIAANRRRGEDRGGSNGSDQAARCTREPDNERREQAQPK
jgi:hypothetical protein